MRGSHVYKSLWLPADRGRAARLDVRGVMVRYTVSGGTGETRFSVKRSAVSAAVAETKRHPDRVICVFEWDVAKRANRVFCRMVWPTVGLWQSSR